MNRIQESYRTLGLEPDADLEEIKSAYRKQAFACHPDLHPDDPQAGTKFQQLNQAYVILLEYKKQDTAQSQQQDQEQTQYQKHTSRSAYSSRAKTSRGARRQKTARQKYSASDQHQSKTKSRERFFSQEEVLKNILNDPFARQVFEDIFRSIKKKKPQLQEKRFGLQGRTLRLPWSNKEMDLSVLSPSGFKLWLRSQLDHEHTIYLHPKYLLPGCSVRFQLQQGPRDKPQTITTVIPRDYQAGRPLRLKGLGSRLGPWKGDLYLRLMARQDV